MTGNEVGLPDSCESVGSRSCSACTSTQRYYAKGLCKRCYEATWAKRQAIPDDVDDVAVLRAVQGDRLPLTRGERIEVVRLLTEQGLSARQIGARLAIPSRCVQRDRQALRVNGLLSTQVAV